MRHGLEIIRMIFIIALAHLKDKSVNDGGNNGTGKRSHPVSPMIRPYILNDSWTKGTCRIHAGASQFDLWVRKNLNK